MGIEGHANQPALPVIVHRDGNEGPGEQGIVLDDAQGAGLFAEEDAAVGGDVQRGCAREATGNRLAGEAVREVGTVVAPRRERGTISGGGAEGVSYRGHAGAGELSPAPLWLD